VQPPEKPKIGKPKEPLQETFEKGKTCPNCKKSVSDQTLICVACGTNLLTGKKFKTLSE
jgi:predicted transcriptional regulator